MFSYCLKITLIITNLLYKLEKKMNYSYQCFWKKHEKRNKHPKTYAFKIIPKNRGLHWNVKRKYSRARFLSSDLWVMSPARFRCATLLPHEFVYWFLYYFLKPFSQQNRRNSLITLFLQENMNIMYTSKASSLKLPQNKGVENVQIKKW